MRPSEEWRRCVWYLCASDLRTAKRIDGLGFLELCQRPIFMYLVTSWATINVVCQTLLAFYPYSVCKNRSIIQSGGQIFPNGVEKLGPPLSRGSRGSAVSSPVGPGAKLSPQTHFHAPGARKSYPAVTILLIFVRRFLVSADGGGFDWTHQTHPPQATGLGGEPMISHLEYIAQWGEQCCACALLLSSARRAQTHDKVHAIQCYEWLRQQRSRAQSHSACQERPAAIRATVDVKNVQ